jgi:hypothetical protein
VLSGGYSIFTPDWNLDAYPGATGRKVIGDKCKIILRLRIGDVPQDIEIPYERK